MTDINKLKKTSLALLGAVAVIFAWYIFQTVKRLFSNPEGMFSAANILFVIGAAIIMAVLTVAVVLLVSIRKDETPFNSKNVRRLKSIAVLLATVEIYQHVTNYFFNRYLTTLISDTLAVKIYVSWGGFLIAAGIVVYCVSLVFEYGISLQQQVDETF